MNLVPKRAIEDVASSVSVTVDTFPADVESTMPISTVPAGRVRAACARLRRPRRVEPRDESQAKGRFAVWSSDDDDARQGVKDDAMEVFDMTRDDFHGEDTHPGRSSRCAIHQGCHAQGGGGCIETHLKCPHQLCSITGAGGC